MIKWILQISAMLSDIVIAGACVLVLFYLPLWISVPLVYLTYKTWESQGGLIAWTHRKEFLDNASRYGL